MKKSISIVLSLLLLFSLAACGGGETPPPAPPEPDTFAPDFTSVESEKMGAYMTWGRYLFAEDAIYLAYSNMLNARYSTFTVEDGVIATAADDAPGRQILEIEELAGVTYLSEGPDDAVYMLTAQGEIARLPKGSDDYSIVTGPGITTLQVTDNKLYYSKGEDSHFFSADLDGQNEASALDKEIYYPYVIGSYILYQDELDNQSLHLYNMNDDIDLKLLEGHVHSPNMVGNRIFCIQKDPETTYGQLVGIEFTGPGEFEVEVYNNNDEEWYANMRSLHYVTREASNDTAGGFVYAGKLMFSGAPVGDFGTDNEEVLTNLEGPMGINAGSLIYNPDRRVGGDRDNLYTSPYGYMYREPLDNSYYWYLNERVIVLADGLYEDEWSEQIIESFRQ